MKTLKQFDDEQAAEWEKHRAIYNCEHPTSELRERTLVNNSLQLVRQCLTCGFAVGSPVKRSTVKEAVPPFDQALADDFEARRRASSDAIREQFNRDKFFGAYGRRGSWFFVVLEDFARAAASRHRRRCTTSAMRMSGMSSCSSWWHCAMPAMNEFTRNDCITSAPN